MALSVSMSSSVCNTEGTRRGKKWRAEDVLSLPVAVAISTSHAQTSNIIHCRLVLFKKNGV